MCPLISQGLTRFTFFFPKGAGLPEISSSANRRQVCACRQPVHHVSQLQLLGCRRPSDGSKRAGKVISVLEIWVAPANTEGMVLAFPEHMLGANISDNSPQDHATVLRTPCHEKGAGLLFMFCVRWAGGCLYPGPFSCSTSHRDRDHTGLANRLLLTHKMCYRKP